MKLLQGKLTYANVMATIAVFIALGGASYAATQLPKNSVGTKQLKNGAVTGQKIAAKAITGENLKLDTLGTVPSATTAVTAQSASSATHAFTSDTATNAANSTHAITADTANSAAHATSADTVDVAKEALKLAGAETGCPSGTLLFHGDCYDTALNAVVTGVKAAWSACSAKGGAVPGVEELYNIRTVVNLGTGIAPDYAATDTYYANTLGSSYRTVTIDGAGKIEEQSIDVPMKYICRYPLLH